MKRVVIGLVGPIASGKGFLAEYLVANGFVHFSLSDRVREEVDARGLRRERKTLQDVGNDLRNTFGASVLARRTVELIPDEVELIVIEGIRNPMEIDYLKATLGVTVVGVDADRELRLGWYLERARTRGEDGVTVEDFFRADERDQGKGEYLSGQQGRMCMEMADQVVVNDGTDRFLRESMDFLRRELGFDPEGRKKEKERL